MEVRSSSSGNHKALSIVGLVIATFSLFFSLIPCVGYYAIFPGGIALIFSIITLLGLKNQEESYTLPLIGTIVAICAICVSLVQYSIFQSVFEAKEDIENSIHEIDSEITDGVGDIILEGFKETLEREIRQDSIRRANDDNANK